MSRLQFRIDLPANLIQAIRLTHALLETPFDVHLPSEHAHKLRRLQDVFGIELREADDTAPPLPGISVEHNVDGGPVSRVGRIERPLIFAHGMADHLETLWPKARRLRVSFAGRLHEARRTVIEEWMSLQFPDLDIPMPNQSAVDRRVDRRKQLQSWGERWLRGPLRHLRQWIELPPAEQSVRRGGVLLMTSDRGWGFPTKAWDHTYFQTLADSSFVLCPDGRFVWTYRFFEAVLCGAIPIVENTCELYDGFRYFTMDDPIKEMMWNEADALHNASHCRKRLTVPRSDMNDEIRRLLHVHA